jgi:hypothetical protein
LNSRQSMSEFLKKKKKKIGEQINDVLKSREQMKKKEK